MSNVGKVHGKDGISRMYHDFIEQDDLIKPYEVGLVANPNQ